jgi:hypothetical protein
VPEEAIVANNTGDLIQTGSFKNQWLNFALYLPNLIFLAKRNPDNSRACQWLVPGVERLLANEQPLGGAEVNTQFLANGNEYQTGFVEIDKTDLLTMLRAFPSKHGYTSDALPTLLGLYRDDPTASTQGATLDQPGRRTFFRGLRTADILRLLVEWNVLS